MRTPKEFAQEVSPTKDGMRHQLELMHLDKHIYEWMRRYAIEYHESEVLKLNNAQEFERLFLPTTHFLIKHKTKWQKLSLQI